MSAPQLRSPQDTSAIDELSQCFEGFALTGNEARVLAALVYLQMATPTQLAQATGINRPNLYPLLESLREKGLAEQLDGSRSTWVAPAPEEALERLEAAEEQRLDKAREALRQRTARTKQLLTAGPARIRGGRPALSLVEEARCALIYEEAMGWVREEILVFNRGPYPGELEVDPLVLAALARGVRARAIWQEFEMKGQDSEPVRRMAEVYARAGADSRVIPALPVSLAILDRRVALLNVPNEQTPDIAYPTNLVCENTALVDMLLGGFEHIWSQATPYAPPSVRSSISRSRSAERAASAT